MSLIKSLNTGRLIIITGAAGHLGSEISARLSGDGCNLLLVGSNIERLNNLRQRLDPEFGSTDIYASELLDERARTRFISDVLSRYDSVSGLVNNAYSGTSGTIKSSSCEDFRRAFEITVVASFHLIQGLMPRFIKAAQIGQPAAIVNVSSMYGHVSPDLRIYKDAQASNPPFYGTAKAGLLQLTRYCAVEFGHLGVRSNSVSPGPIPNTSVQNDNSFIQILRDKNPMGKIGLPKDVAGAISFLLSSEASFVNGADLKIDGGWTAW